MILRYLFIALMAFAVSLPYVSSGQQAKVNQKKIERDKKKHAKEAQRDYRDALKQHHKNQSKETKAMMKQSRKNAKKNMPVRKK